MVEKVKNFRNLVKLSMKQEILMANGTNFKIFKKLEELKIIHGHEGFMQLPFKLVFDFPNNADFTYIYENQNASFSLRNLLMAHSVLDAKNIKIKIDTLMIPTFNIPNVSQEDR